LRAETAGLKRAVTRSQARAVTELPAARTPREAVIRSTETATKLRAWDNRARRQVAGALFAFVPHTRPELARRRR
jgi:hypothetical protein